jgi:hypothetical protein
MSLIRIPRNVQEMKREGLVQWALKPWDPTQDRICHSLCESAFTSYPVVGFNGKGEALIECETIDEAACVPNVEILRIRDLGKMRGFRYRRIAFKFFKAEGSK